MKKGDMVRLKTPEQGRYFTGRIGKEIDDCFKVDLPNGLYVVKPKDLWEMCSDELPANDICEQKSDFTNV